MKDKLGNLLYRVRWAMKPRPLCRDCADNKGRCPNTGELCDPVEMADEIADDLEAEIQQLLADKRQLQAAFDDRVRVIELQIADKQELVAALEASTKELQIERDDIYKSHSMPGTGEVPEEEVREELAEIDAMIHLNWSIIEKATGKK